MAYFRRMSLVCAATAEVAGADALHGFCSNCVGTAPVGATAAGPLIDFGFWNVGTAALFSSTACGPAASSIATSASVLRPRIR
jgi:hypothetical protein